MRCRYRGTLQVDGIRGLYNGGVPYEDEERGSAFSECFIPETDRLDDCLNEIEFMGREPIPKLLVKLNIQPHIAGLSLSNTVSILEMFDIGHA